MRTTVEVINQAIAENRKPEYLLYAFACIFVVSGEILIVWSLKTLTPLLSLIGVALSGLAWPAFRETKTLRAENLMLRMLEVPLSRARTAEQAANMITDSFEAHFRKEASLPAHRVVAAGEPEEQ